MKVTPMPTRSSAQTCSRWRGLVRAKSLTRRREQRELRHPASGHSSERLIQTSTRGLGSRWVEVDWDGFSVCPQRSVGEERPSHTVIHLHANTAPPTGRRVFRLGYCCRADCACRLWPQRHPVPLVSRSVTTVCVWKAVAPCFANVRAVRTSRLWWAERSKTCFYSQLRRSPCVDNERQRSHHGVQRGRHRLGHRAASRLYSTRA
mmetsp:Transcript_25373/g.66364  ORF Transcript_25373/g.66364 Transcript_25373/m.66364 type:complete len:205 (+) Transcript_25373:583-1197(+)